MALSKTKRLLAAFFQCLDGSLMLLVFHKSPPSLSIVPAVSLLLPSAVIVPVLLPVKDCLLARPKLSVRFFLLRIIENFKSN